MTKAKLLSLAPMELMLIVGCPSDYAMLQLHSKGDRSNHESFYG
jgi:hypothetical protein